MRVHVDEKFKVVAHDGGAFYQCDGPGVDGSGCRALTVWSNLVDEKWQQFAYEAERPENLKPGMMTKIFGNDALKNPAAHLCPWCAHAFDMSLKTKRTTR